MKKSLAWEKAGAVMEDRIITMGKFRAGWDVYGGDWQGNDAWYWNRCTNVSKLKIESIQSSPDKLKW